VRSAIDSHTPRSGTRALATCVLLGFLLVGCAGGDRREPTLETEDQEAAYGVGLRLAGSLNGREFSEQELEYVALGLADGVLGREPKVDPEAIRAKVNTLLAVRASAAAEKEKQLGDAFCEEQAQQEGARRLESGAVYIELEPGDGASPEPGDTVTVHYHGTLRDGTVFDSTVRRNMPATFNVDRLVRCFREGLLEMRVGGKAKLVCPSSTAYGVQGSPPKIRGGAALVFEVELLDIPEQP
jgi:FKBP-type peptidyl-prolyl cis-trans isomerase FkpA/FKBP-type peptidyl-prolyl cis-trans isomerase FklB